jgi:hypothetical protein
MNVVNRLLENDVLHFVNSIAEIVHRNVHAWGGQCNKNLGNAFVVVWKIGEEQALLAANSASIQTRKQAGRGNNRSSNEGGLTFIFLLGNYKSLFNS